MSTTEPPPIGSLRRLLAVPGDVYQGILRDDCLGLSAQIAYYGLFSLFPFLLFLRSLVRHIPGKDQVIQATLDGLAALVTTDSRLYEIVRDNIVEQLNAGSPTLLSVGAILTVWGASSAFSVLIKAINRAYGVGETRSWQRRRLTALALTLLAAILIPAGVSLLLLSPRLSEWLARGAVSDAAHLAWTILRWPGTFALLVVPLTVIYLVAPNIRQRWTWVLPGSVFAVGAIILSSLGFSWFIGLNLFELKWFTYGAIGIVIVILFWMYLTGLAILVGAEINGAWSMALGRRPRPVSKVLAIADQDGAEP